MRKLKKSEQSAAETKKVLKPAKIKSLTPVAENDFPIVGIGASAGGIEALEQFFGNMPENNGMAFIIIQHLDPTHSGIMPEILQRMTTMEVFQATERLLVKPDSVYVIPPNKSLSILNGKLHLFDFVVSRGLRLPIDIFFRSLAEDRQEKSIGIILSGMGSDGSLGIKAIKEENGIVLVQDIASAKFDGMPRSAAEAVIPDVVAPAAQLPEKLINYLKVNHPLKEKFDEIKKHKTNLDKIIILLREQVGHDFSLYKKNTLFRRIERRKEIHQIDKIQDYVRFLQENPTEVKILFKELLIGVTNFFRDNEVWETLQKTILPDLLEKLPDRYVLRAWVTGCSTGEEAYSLAIVFKEAMEKCKKPKNLTLQIFATDLDEEAIEKARKGFFPENIAVDVSPERLNRFLKVEGHGYRLNTFIREMVVFATQNVIKDPPFTNLDILSCRNMLIYMEPELQKKLISLFSYSLNTDGILLLGLSETMGSYEGGLVALNNKLKIFKRLARVQPAPQVDFPKYFYSTNTEINKNKNSASVIENIATLAEKFLLQRFSPASVLVNDKGDILYINGSTGKYIEPVAGKANWNINVMAREGLRTILPSVFRKAKQSFEPVIVRDIKIDNNGDTQVIDITVIRIEKPEAIKGLLIIVFHDVITAIEPEQKNQKKSSQKEVRKTSELEMELQRSYEDLQSTREEMQTSQEELKSTNEELQSTNEELQTVNSELQSKISDFVKSNDDMKNLLNSIQIATLFLDRELNIRKFTDQTTQIFKLRDIDIGRPFTDLVTYLQYPEMAEHSKQVLKTLKSINKEIMTADAQWFNVQIMPYRTVNYLIDGLVITFSDITLAKKLELKLKKANVALGKIHNQHKKKGNK